MSANLLLKDIRDFIIAATRDDITEAERASLRFSNGMDIVEAIDAQLGEGPSSVVIVEDDEFDPYTDPDARMMLERAGIATYRYRS